MKAWEQARYLLREARPIILTDEEQTWESDAGEAGAGQDALIKLFWRSNVPGSGAPDSCAVAAIGALENKGFLVPAYSDVLSDGLRAADTGDMESLHVAHLRLWDIIRRAEPDESHPSPESIRFRNWQEFSDSVSWPERQDVDLGESFRNSIEAGWWGQIVGAAAGTALEGYTAQQLEQRFGRITGYVRKPNTYNDDITYELCFLEAFAKEGRSVTSRQIAENWVGLIPFGWSAEAIALDNLHHGCLPPHSGSVGNPFDEWIGAQMRGAICGMVSPGDPREAARLAWLDGEISHTSNGILGEVFNAILCALAFVENDMRRLVEQTIKFIPENTEYGEAIRFAVEACKTESDWKFAWQTCDYHFDHYHWIHAYPNAAAQIVALWFGGNDFDNTLEIICGIGHDADCNAAQILCALAIANGLGSIDERWCGPLGDTFVTYMRRPKTVTISELVEKTTAAVRANV